MTFVWSYVYYFEEQTTRVLFIAFHGGGGGSGGEWRRPTDRPEPARGDQSYMYIKRRYKHTSRNIIIKL